MNAYTQINETVRATMRAKIFDLEHVMKQFPQLELPVDHYKSGGIYVRALHIPKGATIVGKIHKYAHIVMLIKGELSFSVGEEITRVVAPYITRSDPGAKRVIYSHEDSIMVTVHEYAGDADKADDYLVFEKEADWLAFNKQEPMLPLEGDVKCLI